MVAMWKKLVAMVIGAVVGYWYIDDFNPDAVKGKKVLLTGASMGIGEQMAYHYARLGASVVMTARREDRLKEVVARCKELGSPDQTFDYVVADMSDLNSTKRVVEEAVAKLGRLDILVLDHIMKLDLGTWEGSSQNLSLIDGVFKVNFQSYVYLASYTLPYLETTQGSIIVVSSLSGKMGLPFAIIYSGSKFALDGFFSGLRQELKLKNVDVSITLCILGLIGTETSLSQLEAYGQGDLIKTVQPESPSDTAAAIIRGGALRVREMYFPRLFVQSTVMLRDWCTSMLEYMQRSIYTKVS